MWHCVNRNRLANQRGLVLLNVLLLVSIIFLCIAQLLVFTRDQHKVVQQFYARQKAFARAEISLQQKSLHRQGMIVAVGRYRDVQICITAKYAKKRLWWSYC